MRTMEGYPDKVYLSSTEYLFYTTAKQTIASLDQCIKLAKTPEQKLGLFKRRNELQHNYALMCKQIGPRTIERV